MPNNYFQFKQFRLLQENTAMKVSTDACIQGAFFSELLSKHFTNNHINLLDIGSGTGLLTLMVAQKNINAHIYAVEIEKSAYQDLYYNCVNSKWHNRITTMYDDINTCNFKMPFDAIICNPPFFKNHLKGQNHNRNNARHEIHLRQHHLINIIDKLLKEDGMCCVMYPSDCWDSFEQELQKRQLYTNLLLRVFPKLGKPHNRNIGIISKKMKSDKLEQELIIYNEDHSYSKSMKQLLCDYYLYL